MYINKSQGMALLAGADITGLNHTLQQLITELHNTLQAGKTQGSTQNGVFKLFIITLTTGTEQHKALVQTEQQENTVYRSLGKFYG